MKFGWASIAVLFALVSSSSAEAQIRDWAVGNQMMESGHNADEAIAYSELQGEQDTAERKSFIRQVDEWYNCAHTYATILTSEPPTYAKALEASLSCSKEREAVYGSAVAYFQKNGSAVHAEFKARSSEGHLREIIATRLVSNIAWEAMHKIHQ